MNNILQIEDPVFVFTTCVLLILRQESKGLKR